MKYQKDFKKVSFGFGTEKTAGNGGLSETIADDNKRADDKTALIVVGLQLLIAAAGAFFKFKSGKKKTGSKKQKSKKKR